MPGKVCRLCMFLKKTNFKIDGNKDIKLTKNRQHTNLSHIIDNFYTINRDDCMRFDYS